MLVLFLIDSQAEAWSQYETSLSNAFEAKLYFPSRFLMSREVQKWGWTSSEMLCTARLQSWRFSLRRRRRIRLKILVFMVYCMFHSSIHVYSPCGHNISGSFAIVKQIRPCNAIKEILRSRATATQTKLSKDNRQRPVAQIRRGNLLSVLFDFRKLKRAHFQQLTFSAGSATDCQS